MLLDLIDDRRESCCDSCAKDVYVPILKYIYLVLLPAKQSSDVGSDHVCVIFLYC